MNKLNKIILFLIFLGCIIVGDVTAQNRKKDTKKTKTKEIIENKVDTVSNELILDEINIKGELDRPNVIILPKRVEANVKKIDLERKFSKEINKAEGEIPELQEKLREIENIESIKKALNKDRDKNKNNNPEGKKKKENK